MKPIIQKETRVTRTYRGGKLLDEFLGKAAGTDSFKPEDWISSFVEAKNKDYVPNEGITVVEFEGKERYITDVADSSCFGNGRKESGVLIKLLDSAERLGIQVHPTPEYAMKFFNTPFGKTECWHILGTRNADTETPCVYLGFKEWVTKEKWRELFERQDIEGMLDALHRFEVKKGDTILVKGGTPHAIGGGCFMLEIQEPTDYTMRVEKTSVAGERLTPEQIHYGVGEQNMLECFDYTPRTKEETASMFILKPSVTINEKYTLSELVSYHDTECFRLSKVSGRYKFTPDSFVTLVITEGSGSVTTDEAKLSVKKGDKLFVPAGSGEIEINGVEALICYPPKI